jgi:putative NADPH-quinone reductase
MSRIFGAIRQNGYVVHDIEAALDHWINVLGVGPFFYFDQVKVDDFRYRGQPSAAAASIALANSGELQIELIQLRNDAPSMWRDFLDAGHEGLQHFAYWMDTPAAMDAALERVAELGYEIGQSGTVGKNGRFVYLCTESHPGTVVELSEACGWKAKFFQKVSQAAQNWDGSDPIRSVQR